MRLTAQKVTLKIHCETTHNETHAKETPNPESIQLSIPSPVHHAVQKFKDSFVLDKNTCQIPKRTKNLNVFQLNPVNSLSYFPLNGIMRNI